MSSSSIKTQSSSETKEIRGSPPIYNSKQSYPANHFSLANGTDQENWFVCYLEIRGILYMVKVNPSDSRGYRLLVILVEKDQSKMISTLNRVYSLEETMGLFQSLAIVAKAVESLGLIAQVSVAGNNSHAIILDTVSESKCEPQVSIGNPNEPAMLHGHVIARGIPSHSYIPGLPLEVGGPMIGLEFNMRGDGSEPGNHQKRKWSPSQMQVYAREVERRIFDVVNAPQSKNIAIECIGRPTLKSSTTYVNRYYSNLVDTKSPVWYLNLVNTKSPVWDFQEGLRVKESIDFSSNPERASRGWIALDSIREKMKCVMTKQRLPPTYVDFIEAKLASIYVDVDPETKNPNVRRIVKDIWTWPMTGYLPWSFLSKENDKKSEEKSITQKLIEIANEALHGIWATPKLVDGKIYLTLTGFRDKMFAIASSKGIDLATVIPGLSRPLVPNLETEHITYMNSDVLSKLCGPIKPSDHKELTELLTTASGMVLTAHSIMHTISLDWARFGVCLVVGIDLAGSVPLQQFTKDLNTIFPSDKPHTIPSPHITIAIDPRHST